MAAHPWQPIRGSSSVAAHPWQAVSSLQGVKCGQSPPCWGPTLDAAKRHFTISRLAKQFYAAGPHPVQAVRSCSWPECMVLKCNPRSSSALISTEGFVASAPNKTKLRLGLQRNFALVTAMIKAHPCLKRDLQVFLRNDGNVLNLDLDRCTQFRGIRDTAKYTTFTLTTRPLNLTCRA